MATTFITTDTIVPTGVAVSLVVGTNYHVLPGVVVGSEGGDAMSGMDAGISVQVAGSVIGNSAGIRLGDTGDDFNYRIEVSSNDVV